MRPISSLLAILACASPLAAVDSPIAAANQVHEVTLSALTERPDARVDTNVRFRAVFCGVNDLFDREHTYFRPERFYNLIVWDEHAPLWEAEVRGTPFTQLYFSKDKFTPSEVKKIRKYMLVEITGRQRLVVDGRPVIEVSSMRPVVRPDQTKPGAFTDQAISRIEQAIVLANEGAVDLAEEHFSAAMATKLEPSAVARLGAMRGRNLMAGARWQEAEVALDGAAAAARSLGDHDPVQRAKVLALVARCRNELAERGQGSRGAAVAAAREALALDPALGEAYAVLGVSLAGMGQFDEARRQCDIAVRMRPNDAEVRWCLGRILDHQGRHDEAIEAIKKAIDLTPKDHRLHKSIAQAYLNKARKGGPDAATVLETALRECDIALRLMAKDGEAHWIAGQVLEQAAKDKVELPIAGTRKVADVTIAAQRYRQAVEADPALAKAHLSLAEILVAQDRREEIAALAEILAKANGDSNAVETLRKLAKPPVADVPVAPAAGATVPAVVPPAKTATGTPAKEEASAKPATAAEPKVAPKAK